MAATATVLAGIAFPFQTVGQGLPQAAFGINVINSALIVLINTKKRSRVMNPTVGTNLHKLIFEDLGPTTQSLMTRELASAIGSQLPMVQINAIQYQVIPSNPKVVRVNVQYTVQGIANQTGFVTIQG
jgi:phage baseplate assembly protein W